MTGRFPTSPLRCTFGTLLAVAFAVLASWVPAQELTESIDFFERHVRPLLVQRCHQCHAAETREGGLRLDSRAAAIQGGDRGPAIIVGNPNGSLLIKALSYEHDDLAMPPDEKLSSREVGILTEWIATGAAWSPASSIASNAPATSHISSQPFSSHWAFQSIQQPNVPEVQDPTWPVNAIDSFVLHRLETARMTPSAEANPRTLVRRLYLDLLGIPPSYEEVEQFVQSTAGDQPQVAYDLMLDQVLSRREYGERWARHWLDVARYADTKGYVDGGQQEYAFAYTYRDYVIRAFNEDLPFDQFIVDQLAADQVAYTAEDRWRLAAMGFLTVGRRFNHNPYDILDDQIDVISRGLQALTVSCARCHDHKYDPIPAADYYSLYGILASSAEPLQPDLPVLGHEPDTDEYRQYLSELDKRAAAFRETFDELHLQIQRELRESAADYLVYIVKESSRHRGSGQNPLRTERTFLRGPSAYASGAIRRWRNYIYERDTSDVIFGLWHRMDPLAPNEFAAQIGKQLEQTDIHPLVAAAIRTRQPTSMVELAQCYGEVLEQTDAQWNRHREQYPDAERFDDSDLESMRQVLYGIDSPAVMSATESIDCYHLDDSTAIRNKAGEIEKLTLEHKSEMPARAMILREGDLCQPYVFLRGEHTRPGASVPLQLPQMFVADSPRETFVDRSGRLELARQIASPDNRLTARVIVNRVWGWHFGQPLVATPSDFGLRSVPPSHPELLDYLSGWFMDNGWSLKGLHRLIVSSRTYRQSNLAQASALANDPENRLLWRFAPRRLEWESIRDSLLVAGGQLKTRVGGRPLRSAPSAIEANCRTIYLSVDRQNISNFARDFDFPSPDMTAPERNQTIVPQQQLFFLNSPLVMEQARAAAQIATRSSQDDQANIVAIFRQILHRDPTQVELVGAEKYIHNFQAGAWAHLAHGLLQSSEFVYVP